MRKLPEELLRELGKVFNRLPTPRLDGYRYPAKGLDIVQRNSVPPFLLENPHSCVQIPSVTERKKVRQVLWARYPELAALCWNLHTPRIASDEALRLYEDNWRFVNVSSMPAGEKRLLNTLAVRFGSYLHV